uniref:RNA-directed DNA polymerase n=1 Tax=Fagus sylvatica TaxID=28930 RepID=A0A2N9I3X6_FAGSY
MITPVNQRTRIGPQPKDYNKGPGPRKMKKSTSPPQRIPWEPLFHELKKRGLLPAPRAPKESTEAGTCQYHPGARDHNLQGCEEFKKEVAGLITKGLIRRRGEQPERDCMTIDQLRLSPYEKTNFQARMERIEEDFEKFLVIRYATKEKVVPQTASVSAVQSSEKVPSVVIQVPQPFPYQDSKRIPWNYGMKVISTRESKPKTKEEVVGNLTSGLGGITRSGRCYTPEELEKRRKEAGKAVEDPTKTKATEEEAADFLRIIKSSEYSIVKQLSKMPSHISVLSLLLASESHRKALLKVLNEAYVPEDITGPSFENMVTSILVTNQLTFSDDELPPEGRGHTKALYISVKTNDRIVSRVLIDNGSALNVCPLSTLEKLDIDPTRVRVNSMVVRAFDGTRREVLGEIDLPVEIGPQVYDINFQVLRIDSPYNLLLGRPWLHTAGAVPSSLHQKMKLIIGNQLVTILAEEPISIYNDGEIPYIDGCAPEEASFHSFEFVTVIHRVAAVEPRLSKAGIMVAKEFVKAGFQPGQGLGYANQGRTTIVTLEGNKDRYGLGYTPTRRDRQMAYEARRQRAAAKLKGEKWPERKMAIPHIRATFPASAMFQVDEDDVDELALLFTEDLNVNAITTEGDSAACTVHADQHEEIDLEDFLDEENLKGYRIDEETLDEDTWEDDNLPDLLSHLMVPRGLDTLEFEIFCEHGDPESHLQKYREKMALHTNNEFLMISTFHESLPECAVTWFYQLKNLACWGDLARAFLDRYRHNIKAPPPNLITTAVAEEEYAGPMVEGLSIHTITGEEDSTTTPPTRHCQQGEEVKTWTCVPLLQRVSSSNEITRKTSNDPHVSKIDNKTDCSLDNIDNSDEEIELPSDILEALERQDEGSKPNIEELEIVNLANEGEEPREVKIGTRCAAEQKEALIALLREFHEIFAWSYQDMPGLDTDIVVHKIPLKPECKPVKQALRRMKPEVILKIKEEVEKQLKAGFLSTVTYSDWVANIVPVPKKDGKVRMCVDYRDLNRASPKDNFPLPHIDTLVDNTATNVVFSFMDGFSGYNQIKMAEEDKSKTAFITHWGTFVYDVMPFGLKNAGATYQRAMVTLFHDMIHHEIERLKKYQLRLNPNKCAFGVTSGKLLGFIVSGRGIEIDPAKVQAIRSMPAPKTEKEIRSFLGRINYVARFIAQLTATCEPLFKLLRKDVKIKWTEDCQKAFDKIKEYLLNPPILVPPTPGRPLILYLTVQEASMGCMLGQQDETGKKEQAIYYLSKKFTEPETRYLLVEKTCCALAWASKKLRQYMLYYTTWLVSRMDPIKYIFEKPALTGKIARWQVLLSEFDILFVARKAIKGQAIADYLADYPSEQLELMDSEFPDEDVMTVDEDNHGRWKLYFDGAANAVGSGIGAVLHASSACKQLWNSVLTNWKVFGDSLLIVSQTNGEWQARDPKLIPYQRYISRLIPKFKYVTFTYTPRVHNHFADALATLASLIKLVEGDDVRPLRIETRDIPAYCVCIEECMNVEAEIDDEPWYYDIKRFIQNREYPPRATENEKKYVRRMAFQFFLSGEILYKRTHDATLLRCVDAEEANRLIQEMHAGLMGAHANGPFLARKIMRAGYYWLTMERDCIRHVQTCHKCQMYQNSKNAPPQYLHTMASPWPFSAWGMDVIGAITPKASNGHEFILVAIDYFTKWVEACSFKNVTQVAVTRFVKNNIICRYGMPEMLITDNASNLNNRMMDQLCQQFKIQHHNSAPYRPKMNGAVEAANKNVKKILSKMTETYKDWHEHLPYALLCAYRTERHFTRGGSKELTTRRLDLALSKPGDLVLKKRNMALSDPRGKFAPSYEGPYVVKKAFSGGAIILADMDGEEFRSPINSDSKAREATKIRKDVALGWKLPRGYGENLGRGAIGKSNVESWTWRLSAESPQGSGKGRIPLIMLLPDGTSSGTQRIHHLVNLVERSDHRETLLIEPRSIGLKSIMHQIQLGLQNPVVTLENADLNPHDPHGSTRRRESLLTRI